MGATNATQMMRNSLRRLARDHAVRFAHILAFALPLLAVSCAGVKPSAPAASPQVVVPQAATEAVVPVPPNPPPPTVPPAVAAVVAPAPPVAQPIVPASVQPAKVVEPDPRALAKAPASPVPGAQPPKKEGAAPEVAQQKTPPLDLASLEQRLKDTKAIGVLTKISLKNQVDDLLSQFRAFYQGKLKITLAELRRSYDLLLLKVLALLQDSDPTLASTIVASREAIWALLSDPAKFATI
jgi:hypothetical protein